MNLSARLMGAHKLPDEALRAVVDLCRACALASAISGQGREPFHMLPGLCAASPGHVPALADVFHAAEPIAMGNLHRGELNDAGIPICMYERNRLCMRHSIIWHTAPDSTAWSANLVLFPWTQKPLNHPEIQDPMVIWVDLPQTSAGLLRCNAVWAG